MIKTFIRIIGLQTKACPTRVKSLEDNIMLTAMFKLCKRLFTLHNLNLIYGISGLMHGLQ